MKGILILAGVLAALALLRVILPFVIGRLLVGVAGRIIGNDAADQQPDAITLVSAGTQGWADAAAAKQLSAPLLSRGFEDAGVHRVPEMPGLTVQLLAKPDESLLAAVYEHPQAGHWIDLFARYRDRTSITFTTAKVTGLKPRPGHPTINDPGATPAALYARARQEMPKRPLEGATAAAAGAIFTSAYAESAAWRKEQGISAGEVAQVLRRAA